MHAAGNDYIYVDGDENEAVDFSAAARKLGDRRFGVGSDGLIAVFKDESGAADFFMRIFNADGSEGATCGNGLRCSAAFARIIGKTTKSEIKIRTLSAVHNVVLEEYAGEIIASADFPLPKFASVHELAEKKLCEILGLSDENDEGNENEISSLSKTNGKSAEKTVCVVNNGNLHAVFFGAAAGAETLATKIIQAGIFKDGINVESATADESSVCCDVYERGSGITYSCGSGAVATAFAAREKLGLDWSVYPISMRGGTLFVKFDDKKAYLSGAVTPIYKGEIFEDYYRNAFDEPNAFNEGAKK